jgi:enoyl-[acyl-carrier-protein] reductase (NADH)
MLEFDLHCMARHGNSSIGNRMTQNSGLMKGKRGVILGVADNRSIAWGIAKACHAAGAEIALTWQGDALKKRVEPLGRRTGRPRSGTLRCHRSRNRRCGVRRVAVQKSASMAQVRHADF